MERELAAILLQVQGPQLLQRLFSQNQASNDLRDLWQDHHVSDVQPFEKQKMHHEKARIRNRAIEKGTRTAQNNRVNFNNQEKIIVKLYLKLNGLLILWQQQPN